ncbi:reversion-inducing cysteine-rich protein with Kazal motifs [Thalassophryne amazonica]|uniref:reversion-inducing cysteine-rich protein with Kazal motifs n=1 Tax=Thalassophryne amazonica TaxID=390379 RepID=UPI0014709E8F|nr:reversion-inducing cysteine-rich protein with Kazal motifs [Thalassophryne amazonica]
MRACFQIVAFLLSVNFCWQPLRAQDPSCCNHAAEFSSCKEACDQLTSIKSESRLKHLLQRLPSYCPESMNELWMCINSTLPGVSKKTEGWVGLGCCELAISPECRRECKQASSKNDITKICKKVTEKPLYSCITKNEMGSTCCSYAGRHTTCREYCQAIFRTDSTPTVSQINSVKDYCQSHSSQLLSCVSNFTKSYPIRSPIDSLYCCDRAEDTHCQVACRRILRTMSTEHEIMEGLINECGSQPLPQDPLWQCFLGSAHPPAQTDVEASPPAKMDCAKLHCCSKANTSLCRDMCQEISTNWGSQTWQEFDQLCEYNPVETDLINCLADVREPCQLGCKDLTYCTNFNNRPTELFRSCNVQSDQGAMNDFKLWSNGSIKMPFMNIPVLDIRKCLPDMWKAVACSLQIKPCHSKSRGSVICRSDCVDILTQCGDRKRFHEGQTPERICDLLSPIDDPERCIPLQRYLAPTSFGDNIVEEVIHPCNPNPCPSNHLCQVNRKGCLDELTCQPYMCVPGCKLGEASEFLVQQEARIQVPTRMDPAGCYEVCSCAPSGRLENCMNMPCVDINKPCIVGGQTKNHGTSFMVECHPCFCFAGKTICSTRECLSVGSSVEERQRFTGLPCGCPDRFVPVCASNGRTYPSACVARCKGFLDNHFVYGQCRHSDPCASKPCQRNQRCVPKWRVCLSDLSECLQYECVGRPAACDRNSVEPVCDTDGLVHASLCQLQQSGKTLAYMGHCQDVCKKPKPVCGHNGETYKTVCDAFSDRVAVDYEGPCHTVGTISDLTSDSACGLIRCPPLSTPGCKPVTPPGACCPVCASMLQILWNTDQMNTFSMLNNKQPVTVHDVLQILRLHISVPQCDIFGYLSIDHELVVLIAPVDHKPTSLQVEACSKEAEKIDSLINYASPTLVAHVPLSAFLTSEIKTSSIQLSGAAHLSPLTFCFLFSLLLAAPALCLD